MKIKVLSSPIRLPIIYSYFYQELLEETQGENDDDEVVDVEFVKEEARKSVLEILDTVLRTGKPNIEYVSITGALYQTGIALAELCTELTERTNLRYVDIEFYDSLSLLLTFDTKGNAHGDD